MYVVKVVIVVGTDKSDQRFVQEYSKRSMNEDGEAGAREEERKERGGKLKDYIHGIRRLELQLLSTIRLILTIVYGAFHNSNSNSYCGKFSYNKLQCVVAIN